MNYEKHIEKILETLLGLESKGDIVITTTTPKSIAQAIFHSSIELLLNNKEQSEALIECDIPYLLEETATHLSAVFLQSESHSNKIVNAFYHKLLQRLNMREIAEMIWHETPFEIALLSYYCIELNNSDSRDLEYLEWRKKYYAK